MEISNLTARVKATMKSADTEGKFELYVTRMPGYLWALLFERLHVHPVAVTLVSIVIGMLAGVFFCFDDVRLNMLGMFFLIWANWYDCADGQLARMTGKTSLIGRILDGFAGDLWFFSIYFFICLRLTGSIAPWGREWGVWIWLLAAFSGFYCHARQCALADYYRNIHCYIVENRGELDTSREQNDRMRSLHWNAKGWFEKLYLFFYRNYTRGQERQTPEFQRLFPGLVRLRQNGSFPETISKEWRKGSLPLMPLTNILTFDTRVIVLFITLLLGMPWIFFVFEIFCLEPLRYYTRRRHESLSRDFRLKLHL